MHLPSFALGFLAATFALALLPYAAHRYGTWACAHGRHRYGRGAWVNERHLRQCRRCRDWYDMDAERI
jgi:hypothetical protein